MINLLLGDCLERLRELPDASVDACVTDPPYGLSFMGKGWDHSVPSVEVWREVWRVLKPGAHLLAFFGTRTYHRGVVAVEDAGFEIRDQIGWAFGSGFPKSHDVSKAIDAAAGAVREVVGANPSKRSNQAELRSAGACQSSATVHAPITAPATPDAQRWQGWGTALKPAWEPIVVARKPLEGTVAANVLAWGTGAINVDGCRVSHSGLGGSWGAGRRPGGFHDIGSDSGDGQPAGRFNTSGRWPANLIHDGSDEVVGLFPVSSSGANPTRRGGLGYHGAEGQAECAAPRGAESGSAARFFYCAKASRADREDGLNGFEARRVFGDGGASLDGISNTVGPRRNHHPTVKPTDLMRYLCRLVTPPGGVVLDPFMGSGSTGRGAVLEGFSFIGCELDPEYLEIARARIAAVDPTPEPQPEVPAPAGQLPLW